MLMSTGRYFEDRHDDHDSKETEETSTIGGIGGIFPSQFQPKSIGGAVIKHTTSHFRLLSPWSPGGEPIMPRGNRAILQSKQVNTTAHASESGGDAVPRKHSWHRHKSRNKTAVDSASGEAHRGKKLSEPHHHRWHGRHDGAISESLTGRPCNGELGHSAHVKQHHSDDSMEDEAFCGLLTVILSFSIALAVMLVLSIRALRQRRAKCSCAAVSKSKLWTVGSLGSAGPACVHLSEVQVRNRSVDSCIQNHSWISSPSHLPTATMGSVLVEEQLGNGGFGVVYKGQWRGQDVAVKIIQNKNDLTTEDGESLESEVTKNLHHPNIVHTYFTENILKDDLLNSTNGDAMSTDLSTQKSSALTTSLELEDTTIRSEYDGGGSESPEETRTCIVMEYCDLGTLSAAILSGFFMDQQRTPQPRIYDVLVCALDVALALNVLHQHGIIHGDLKAGNVFLKTFGEHKRGYICKVGDFGLSRQCSQDAYVTTDTVGTITHTPPEILLNGVLTQAADVYSFGILLWELISGDLAYNGMDTHEIVFKVASGGRPEVMPHFPQCYITLMQCCWHQSHLRRPNFSTVVQKLQEMVAEFSAVTQGFLTRSKVAVGLNSYCSKQVEPQCPTSLSLPQPLHLPISDICTHTSWGGPLGSLVDLECQKDKE